MQTYYNVFNPADGTYQRVDAQNQLLDAIADVAVSFYMLHAHSKPYVVVEVDADGNETWTSTSGDPIDSPAQLEAAAKSRLAMLEVLKNQTEISVTRLGE